MSEKNTGRVVSQETKDKQSKAKLGIRGEKANHWLGGGRKGYNGYNVDCDGVETIYTHRKIAIEAIGLENIIGKHIHHIDFNKQNNSKEN